MSKKSRVDKIGETLESPQVFERRFDELYAKLDPTLREIDHYGAITSDLETARQLMALITDNGYASPALAELIRKTEHWNNMDETGIWIDHDSEEHVGYWNLARVRKQIIIMHNFPEATMLNYDDFRKAVKHFHDRGQLQEELYNIAKARIPGGIPE